MRIILTQLKSAQIRQKYNNVLFHYNTTQNNYLMRNICCNNNNKRCCNNKFDPQDIPNIVIVMYLCLGLYCTYNTIKFIITPYINRSPYINR